MTSPSKVRPSGSRYKKREPSLNRRERDTRDAWEKGYADGYASGAFFYHPLEVAKNSHPMYQTAYIKGFNDFKGSHEIRMVNPDLKFDKENHPAELM